MKTTLRFSVFLLLCLAAPIVSTAQQLPPSQMQTQVPANEPCGNHAAPTTPSQAHIYSRFMRRLAPANLTPQQQAQIQNLVAAYSQAHPAGSPVDRSAMRQLREQVQGLLSPAQQQAIEAARGSHGGGGAGHAPCRP